MDLIDRLYQKINEDPLTPKVLLAGSYAPGHQLLERMVKRYGAVFNVEVQTVRDIIIANSKLELSRRSTRLLDDGQAIWMIRQLMKQLAEEDSESYINQCMLNLGIVSKVFSAILEMRMTGIQVDDVKPEQFASLKKGQYMQRLLARYESYLREHNWTDTAGLAEYLKPIANGPVYLAFLPTGWSQAEQRMIHLLAGGKLCFLDPEEPFYKNEDFSKNNFTMFRATGSLAEVREGFRRILSEPVALDRTEIILSDYEQYAPVIHSHSETLGIACTFSNGLPLVFCAAGKAAVGILNWIEEGYPAKRLTEMLRHGYISFGDERWSRSDWVRMLEKSGIGWGRERYFALLSPDRLSEEEQTQGEVLYQFMKGLFNQLPEGDEWNPLLLFGWVADFVRNYATTQSLDDAGIAAALQETNDRYLTSEPELMPMDLAISYVREMLNGIRIRVSATPKPAAVHISSLSNGGWSGRDRTWIVGMDERAWSISAVQDPLLLDRERIAMFADLELVQERASKVRRERESRLSLIRGEIWLSYVSYDSGEQKTQNPAFELLQILRLQTGDSSLDFEALEHSLGEPHNVMDMAHSRDSIVPFDGNDMWLCLLRNANGGRSNGQQVMHNLYPALIQGHHAQILRLQEGISAYDGWLDIDPMAYPEKLQEDSSGTTISVSQLEKYSRCGLQYYFYNVLKLRPKEIAKFERTRWLQASDRGTLLHDIFRRYMEDVTNQGTVSPVHDKSRLDNIVDTVIEETALTIPAPNCHVYSKECEEIRRDADVFYRCEIRRTDHPIFFELELTTQDGGPIEVQLSESLRIRLNGFVDRVDRIGPHEYRIIDYKTGGTSKYKASEYFSGGKQLQHALYSIAVEQWLRKTGADPEARVVEADYYFPTERGRGEFVRRVQNRRDELAVVIARLMETRSRGLYIPAKDPSMCKWCDYQAVCGPHSEWMSNKRESSANADILSSLLEVEGNG
ncbi:PD-(D/E)XK nuclease superfamily protein [Paenibacillaceae bacterium GAS479]|nr:PD-(D/E)XK nuclease superfamily protein [Paenibacillaceae bacterium GAS479]